jgi:hypothetical protein
MRVDARVARIVRPRRYRMPVTTGILSPELIVSLTDLWLPVLIATVAVFFLSMIAWTAAPHHKAEFRKLAAEPGVLDSLRKLNIPAGGYFFPYVDGAGMKTEEGRRLMNDGPWGRMRLYGKKPAMGSSLLGSFLLYLVVSVGLAFIGSATLPAGAAFERVLHVLGVAAILAYSAAVMPQIIWFERSWRMFLTHLFDGVVYGAATGLIFAWLWPTVAAPSL